MVSERTVTKNMFFIFLKLLSTKTIEVYANLLRFVEEFNHLQV